MRPALDLTISWLAVTLPKTREKFPPPTLQIMSEVKPL